MKHSSLRSRRHRNPHTNEGDRQIKPFFSKSNSDSIQKKADKVPFFQAKLKIGNPNDKYEQEADTMANSVVNGSNSSQQIQAKEISTIQRNPLMGNEEEEAIQRVKEKEEEEPVQMMTSPEEKKEEETVQSKESEEEEEAIQRVKEKEEELQMKPETGGKTATPQLSSRIQDKTGKGKPLPDKARVEMENSFGADFSGINIHTDTQAVQLNKELGAQAFTHGRDVYFNAGKYRPESSEGKRLLAHELTHVIQQGASPAVRGNSKHQNSDIVQNCIQKQDSPNARIRRRARQWMRSGEGGYVRDERIRVRYRSDREDFLEEVRQVLSARMVSSNEAEREFARAMINYYGDVYEVHSRFSEISEYQELELVARITRRDTEAPSDRWILAIRIINPNFIDMEDDEVQGETRSIRERELIQLSHGFGRMASHAREIDTGDSHDATLSGAISAYCNNLIRLSRGERTMIPHDQYRGFARPYVEMAERDWRDLTSGRGNPALYRHPNEVISNCRAWARQELSQHGNTTNPETIESFVNLFNGYRHF